MKPILILALVGFVTSVSCSAASFDCSKARSVSEHLICDDPQLSSLDDGLARQYARAKEAAPDKAAFQAAIRKEWNWREKNCADKECLARWFDTESVLLQSYINAQAPAAAQNVNAPSNSPVEESGAIKISAAELYRAYHDNQLAADQKFKGKRLAVTGVVKDVGRELMGDPYVALVGSPDGFGTVPAYFSKNKEDALAKLHKGEVVTVTCTGNGKTITFPTLDCHSK